MGAVAQRREMGRGWFWEQHLRWFFCSFLMRQVSCVALYAELFLLDIESSKAFILGASVPHALALSLWAFLVLFRFQRPLQARMVRLSLSMNLSVDRFLCSDCMLRLCCCERGFLKVWCVFCKEMSRCLQCHCCCPPVLSGEFPLSLKGRQSPASLPTGMPSEELPERRKFQWFHSPGVVRRLWQLVSWMN